MPPPDPPTTPPQRSSEFKQVKECGRGGFSIVFRACHRLDGCEYALKRTKNPVTDNKERNVWLQVRQDYAICRDYAICWRQQRGRLCAGSVRAGACPGGRGPTSQRAPPHDTLAPPLLAQEVQALAAVGAHPHIVQYYSAWAEPDMQVGRGWWCL